MDLDRIRKLAGMGHGSTIAPSQLREANANWTDGEYTPVKKEAPIDKGEWPEGFDATYAIQEDIEELVAEKGGYHALPEKLLREIKQMMRSLGEINYRATEAPEGEGTDNEDIEEMGTLRRQAESIIHRLNKMKSEKVQESSEVVGNKLDFSKKKSETLVALEEAIDNATECNLTLCEDGAEALLDIEALGLKKVGNVTDLGSLVFTVYEDVDSNLWFYTSADSKTIVETTLKMDQLIAFHTGEINEGDYSHSHGPEALKIEDELKEVKNKLKAAQKTDDTADGDIEKLETQRDALIAKLSKISSKVADEVQAKNTNKPYKKDADKDDDDKDDKKD